VRAGAKECAKEVVEFVENLGRGALDAFWHSCKLYSSLISTHHLKAILRVTGELRYSLILPYAAVIDLRERGGV
jgi:hypothetical protein